MAIAKPPLSLVFTSRAFAILPKMARVLSILLVLLIATSFAYAQTVYITRTGAKYHSGGCRYLSKSKISTSLDEAVQSGYTPCSVCSPPRASEVQTQQQEITTTTQHNTTSTRCTGTTKAGSQCKRMTTNASGRCYQH
jgi:hypothetical protein